MDEALTREQNAIGAANKFFHSESSGICSICGAFVAFQAIEGYSLREATCPECGGSKRSRDLSKILVKTFMGNQKIPLKDALGSLKELSIFEAQSQGPIHDLLRTSRNYVCSEYMEAVPWGAYNDDGVRCENLESLTFEDNHFDLVITQDVFEHMSNPWKAFEEIRRVLKPGGYHLFTVPYHSGKKTKERVVLENGQERFLLPPVYHLDPLREVGSLVYTDFGEDLTTALNSMGFPTEIAHEEIYYAEDQVPRIENRSTYEQYLISKQRGDLLRFFLYNSVVFRSRKEESPKMGHLKWTGERYVPWIESAMIGYEHLHRYRFAKEYVRGKSVLDMACGEGYGSFLLSEDAAQVVGIDIDPACIRHANSKYLKENLTFLNGSIAKVPLDGSQRFDVIVCFEAIEHIEQHEELMNEFKRLMKPDGVLLISTPNKYAYSERVRYENPYHVKELYFDEFKALLENRFGTIFFYGQQAIHGTSLYPLHCSNENGKEYAVAWGGDGFYFPAQRRPEPKYFIAAASDSSTYKGLSSVTSYLIDLSERFVVESNDSIDALRRHLEEKEQAELELRRELDKAGTALHQMEREMEAKKTLAEEMANELQTMKTSKVWRTAEFFRWLVYRKVPYLLGFSHRKTQ